MFYYYSCLLHAHPQVQAFNALLHIMTLQEDTWKAFSNEDANDYMMRACKVYGGLNQDSVQKKETDLLLQDIFEFKCNFANKNKEELDIDGKSSKRLNGTIAKQKCERLGFKVGSKDFANCLQELTQ